MCLQLLDLRGFYLLLGMYFNDVDFDRLGYSEDTMMVGEDKWKGIEVVGEYNFPKGRHVLAVDDHPIFLKILEALLRHCKYHHEPLNLHSFSDPLELRLYELLSINNASCLVSFCGKK